MSLGFKFESLLLDDLERDEEEEVDFGGVGVGVGMGGFKHSGASGFNSQKS